VKPTPALVFAAVLSIAAIAAVAAGFVIIGSPAQIRVHRLDDERVSELRNLTNAIAGYRRSHNRLPDTLDELQQTGTWPAMRHGPYEYRPTGAFTYDLCTDFSAASDGASLPAGQTDPWRHGSGHVCFTREARS
jgi:type II secretory pathway pseudopilin PulG